MRFARILFLQALRLLRSRDGSVAVTFSFCAFALACCAGAAIDYGHLARERTLLAAAADAAVLSGASAARSATVSGASDPAVAAAAAARAAWDRNTTRSRALPGLVPVISVTRNGGEWLTSLTYDARLQTSFMSIFGIKTMQAAGTAEARAGYSDETPKYWDFQLVADTSSSMGMGATPADMSMMRTKYNCEFACHSYYATHNSAGVKFVSARPADARKAGIVLRIDLVDAAIDALVGRMKTWSSSRVVRAQLWGMNDTPSLLVPLTSTLDDISAYRIDIAKPKDAWGQTNLTTAVPALSAAIPQSGAGRAEAEPRQVMFLITDGLHDSRVMTPNTVKTATWMGTHYLGPIDPAYCDDLKSRGVTIGILHVAYYVPANYGVVVNAPLRNVIPNLKACASPGLFYSVTDTDGIAKALDGLFNAAIDLSETPVRLSN